MAITTAIDPTLGLLLVDASIQAYNAYDANVPAVCNPGCVTPPAGYDVVDTWTGVDPLFFATYSAVECYGVVFRSTAPPYTYIFAFRGTYSMLDLTEDLFFEWSSFRTHTGQLQRGAHVVSGFWSIYATAAGKTPSMQSQVFALIDRYQRSAKPISRLLITGHSLGGCLAELFTLDLALSTYGSIPYFHYNYAAPRVGNSGFKKLYDGQARELNPATRTLRIQNTYDIVPCYPTSWVGFEHVGDAYLVAFYNAASGWFDRNAKFYDHSAVNYRAVLECAFKSPGGVCINNALNVPTDAETLVSKEPDPSTLCWFWAPSATATRPFPTE